MTTKQLEILKTLFGKLTRQEGGSSVGRNTSFGIEFIVTLTPGRELTIHYYRFTSVDDFLFRVGVIGGRLYLMEVPRIAPVDGLSWPSAMEYFRKELRDSINNNFNAA